MPTNEMGREREARSEHPSTAVMMDVLEQAVLSDDLHELQDFREEILALLSSLKGQAALSQRGRDEALEEAHDFLEPINLGDGLGMGIMGPDGTYWPWPLDPHSQKRWAAWIKKARSLLSVREPSGSPV